MRVREWLNCVLFKESESIIFLDTVVHRHIRHSHCCALSLFLLPKMLSLAHWCLMVLAALSQVFVSMSADVSCAQKLETMDRLAAKILVVTDPQLTHYASVDDFDAKYCRQLPTWLKEGMLPYKSCLRSFQGSIFSIAIRNMKKLYREYCLDAERRKSAYNHLRCVSSKTKAGLLKVNTAIYNAIDFAATRENIDEVIPQLCCGVHYALAYTEEKVSQICHDITGPATGRFFVRIFNSTASDVLDLLCSQYSSTSQCLLKVPHLTKQVTAALHSPTKVHTSTPLIPVMKVLSKLDYN